MTEIEESNQQNQTGGLKTEKNVNKCNLNDYITRI
jgi:hypothetical protein